MAHRQQESLGEEGVPILSLPQGAGVFGEWHTGNGSLWERKGSPKAHESLEKGTPAARVFGGGRGPHSLPLTRSRGRWRMAHRVPHSLRPSQGAGVFGEWHTGNESLWERKGPRSLSFSQGAGVFGEWHTGNESLWERKGSPFSLFLTRRRCLW